jgi:hypothetical protein
MSVPDSLKGHPPDPPDDDDEAREADEFARRDRIDDYTPATAIPKETKAMSGYGYDTETLTLVVILPDGEPVRVVGENDGLNGFEWSAWRGAGELEVRTDHRVLIDGVDEENDDEAEGRATCSRCLARTYRDEQCVCEDGGDAEDYDEVREELAE